MVQVLLLVLACYLVGSFPTGVVLSKRKFGMDVREMGSGNIGATNITRIFGWYAGFLTLTFDALKGFVPLWVISRHFPDLPSAIPLCGLALVAGHCFSVFLSFRGGKGVATSLGCLASVAPWAALGAAVVYGVVLLISRISALGSLAGLATVNFYCFFFHPPMEVTLLVLGLSFLVLVRHSSNIKRLWGDLRGTEKR